MLTTKEILQRTSEEFGVPIETVEVLYKAWVKGLKDRVAEDPVMVINFPNSLKLHFTTKVKTKDIGITVRSEALKKSKMIKTEAAEKIRELNVPHNLESRKKKFFPTYFRPPLYYYGYKQGYSLTELERIQQKMFDLYNTHDYTKKGYRNNKAKN